MLSLSIHWSYKVESLVIICSSFPLLSHICPRFLPNQITHGGPNFVPFSYSTLLLMLILVSQAWHLAQHSHPAIRDRCQLLQELLLTSAIKCTPSSPETLKTLCLCFLSTHLSFYPFTYSFHNMFFRILFIYS